MEGYYDDYTYEEWTETPATLTKIVGLRRNQLEQTNENKYIYQFMMTPNAGFLNENKVNLNSNTTYYLSNLAFTAKYRTFTII